MPDSQVVVVMRQFKAALLRQESAQMREMASRWLAVERRLDGHMAALALLMQDAGTITEGMLFREERYRRLLAQLQEELDRYTTVTERTITDRQRQLGRLGIAHAREAIEVQGVRPSFDRLPTEAVENMVGLAGNGSPLRRLLMDAWPDAAQGLTQELISGVALGLNPRTLARNMATGATRSLNRMMVIARTEQLRVYREANLQSYRSSGVVSGYRRLATHDSRVCPACLMDEGRLYELSETMPEHPQGRCTMIPVVVGMPAVRWKRGADWFVEQPQATQQSILGKERYDAWQVGAFALDELVRVVSNPIWGDSLQTTPLRVLTGGQ